MNGSTILKVGNELVFRWIKNHTLNKTVVNLSLGLLWSLLSATMVAVFNQHNPNPTPMDIQTMEMFEDIVSGLIILHMVLAINFERLLMGIGSMIYEKWKYGGVAYGFR